MSRTIIVSFRRTGSHLLKDIFNNNFKRYQRTKNFEDISIDKILEMKQDEIITCHGTLSEVKDKINICSKNDFKIILLTRDMKDVSTSFLFYCNWKSPQDCYRHCLEKQLEFYESWRDFNFDQVISFEAIINDYESSIELLANTVSLKLVSPIVDVRSGQSRFKRKEKYKNFRKGIVGDYKNNMPPEFLEKYNVERNYGSFIL